MAKALLGYINGTDPRAVAQLAAENRRLHRRVEDLEAHVLRLQSQNAALAAASDREPLTVPDEMQLA